MMQTISSRPPVDTLGGLAMWEEEPAAPDRAGQTPVFAGGTCSPPPGYVLRRADQWVTQEHIDSGVPGSETECPVALAILEMAERLGIHFDHPVCVGPGAARGVSYGLDIIEFIRKVDAGEPVEPVELSMVYYVPA
jgi:hypothetical protein